MRGGASIAPDDYKDNGVATVPKGAINSTGIADLSGSKYVSKEFFEKNKNSSVYSDELVTSLRDLVPSAPNMGRIVKLEGKDKRYLMPQGVYNLILLDEVDENFLISFSNTSKFRRIISQEKNGSTQVHIRNSEYLGISIDAPDAEEQNKIGSFFKKLDVTIALHQRKLSLFNQLKETYLKRMFPQNEENMPVLRFADFSEPWEQRKLGEISDIVGGGTPSTSTDYYWNGNIDWYSPAEIGNQIFVNDSQKKITEAGLQKSSAKILPIGAVLFTSRAGIGNTAILAKEGATNQGFQSIIPHENELDSYFIYSRTHELKRYGELNGAGSTFIEVSGKQMAKMPILMPRIEEQIHIGSFFRKLDDTITLHQYKIKNLTVLKKVLLAKMFL